MHEILLINTPVMYIRNAITDMYCLMDKSTKQILILGTPSELSTLLTEYNKRKDIQDSLLNPVEWKDQSTH